MTMHWIDWAVVAVPMVVVIIIGYKTYRYVNGVSDFLAAGRLAGRYLVCTSELMANMGLINAVAMFQVTYNSGFALKWWDNLSVPIWLFITLTGYVIYRYRETRAMTMAQFFEIRYSRRFRLFAGFLAAVSGIVNYGIFPAVAGRFFVYYCGLPETVSVHGLHVPTFGILMAIFLSAALFLVLLGGQLTVMVTDCVQGLFSYVMFLIVAIALLYLFSWADISSALATAPAGKSMLHPFQIGKMEDFNIWFVLIWIFGAVYSFTAWQGNQGFNCSAASPHEAKMGKILGTWRGFALNVMIVLLPICAYTFFHNPHYAAQAAGVTQVLKGIENTHIQDQMQVPLVMSYVLPVGVKGVFCAIMFFLMITTDVSYLHSWGSIVIQDVVLPFRRRPFTPRQHLWLLRLSITGVAVFAFFFSLLFRQVDYIMMFFAITGAIFLGGAGSVIVGGLYWRKGTTAGAWCSMIVGSVLAVAGIVIKQIDPAFPVNGTVMWFISMVAAIAAYIVVSLATCREDFNMEQMLHRGKYARDAGANAAAAVEKPPRTWKAFLGIDEHFTRGDKILSIALFSWSMFWFAVFVVITVMNLIRPWPVAWWSSYWYYTWIIMPIVLGVVTSIWYTVGGICDLRKLFRGLRTATRNTLDDGRVVDHRNLDEAASGERAVSGGNGTIEAGESGMV